MGRSAISALVLGCLSLTIGCERGGADERDVVERSEALAASTASGVIPAGLPSRVLVGVFEGTGQTWMKTSGVQWGTRYCYFTKGWANNWGYSAYDGSWGL